MRGLTARELGLLLQVRDGAQPQAFDAGDSAALMDLVPTGRLALSGSPLTVQCELGPVRVLRIKLTDEGRKAIQIALIAGVDPS